MAESKTWSNTESGSYTQHTDSMTWTSTSKKTNCSNNSSSSDEEDQEEIQRLKEAAISIELLHTEEEKRSAKPSNGQDNIGQTKQPSLRQNQKDETDYKQLHTTPSFQIHIAKKLSHILDKELEFSESCPTLDDSHSFSDTGIKLLSTSKDFVKLHEVIPIKKQPLKKTHDSSSDSSDEDAKFAEAAISYNAIKLKDQLLSAFDSSTQKTETPKLENASNDSKTKQKTKTKKGKKMKKDKD